MARPYSKLALCLVSLLCLVSHACKTDSMARVLALRTAVHPDSQCVFAATNTPYTQGFYDPSINGGQGMALGFVLQNNTGATGDEQVSQPPAGFVANIDTRRHDAQVEAVEGCWVLTNGLDAKPLEEHDDGSVIDCTTLPVAQQRIEYLGATAIEGGGQAVINLRLLNLTDLQALFGATFDPYNVPVVGVVPATDAAVNPAVANLPQSDAVKLTYSYNPASPADTATRSAAWGANYPTDAQARVLLQFRVRAKLLSGGVSYSNWMKFPITICPGCMRGRCGNLVQQVCGRGPCTDGTPCMSNGQCAAGAPAYCTPITLFSGSYPNFAQPSSCLPAQDPPGVANYLCEGVGCEAETG